MLLNIRYTIENYDSKLFPKFSWESTFILLLFPEALDSGSIGIINELYMVGQLSMILLLIKILFLPQFVNFFDEFFGEESWSEVSLEKNFLVEIN